MMTSLHKRPGHAAALVWAVFALLMLAGAPVHAEPFAVARVHYGGGGDWYSDPSSLVNLQREVSERLGIPTRKDETVVKLLDEDLARHPYLYMTGHGNVRFTDDEALRLREHLLDGGFLHVDDNYGLDKAFRRELAKVFPDRELAELPFDHPIYHTVYDMPAGLPKIHEHDGKPPQGLAIVVDGRVVLFYTYESDLGDGWEDPEVHSVPPGKREAALRMGLNIVAYALSGSPRQLP